LFVVRHRRRKLLALAAIGSLVAEPALAQFAYEEYRPASIAEAVAQHPRDSGVDRTIDAAPSKHRVQVIYAGEHRPLPDDIREFVSYWRKSMPHGDAIADLLQNEILVLEGDTRYWLPIQEPLLPSLGQEVKQGGPVALYLLYAGSTRTRDVFFVNEFQALQDPR
jgi:hypothetical protein